jgi:hypothetical protein
MHKSTQLFVELWDFWIKIEICCMFAVGRLEPEGSLLIKSFEWPAHADFTGYNWRWLGQSTARQH